DPQVTLRVRVIAPLEARVARIAARDGLDEGAARAKILRIDGERIAFNKQHYGADISEATNYDLVVNAGTLGIEGAADLAARAFRGRFGQG
ncbi:MAG TPA: cytidylate kinase family protein, partial [Polyangia bacterium]|nr:cytidylate kinase family protein [Polyangia bacterium]